MKLNQEDILNRQTILNIEVEPEELDGFLNRAYQRLVRRVVVPGFRKGKAPRTMVERLVGYDRLLEEALEILVPEITSTAVQNQGLEISTMPEVEVVETSPVKIKATVALTPGVTLGDYRSLRIPVEEISIDASKIHETLEEIRRDSSIWEPVERPAQIDDLVVIDVDGTVDGNQLFQQKDTNYVITQEALPLPGFGDALVGMTKEESKEFSLVLPDEFPEPEMRGKTCDITVITKEIKERSLPDLDDEFAAGIGQGYESLNALEKDIEDRLRTSAQTLNDRAYEESVMEKVLELSTLEIPPLLLKREIDHLLHEQQDEGGTHTDLSDYVAKLGKSEEEVRQELSPQAETRLKRAALLGEVALAESINVNDERIEEEISKMVSQAGGQGNQIRRLFGESRQKEALARSIRTRETIERLASIAKGGSPEPMIDSIETETKP